MMRLPVGILAIIGVFMKPLINGENVLAEEIQNPEEIQDRNADESDQSGSANRAGQVLRRQQLMYYQQPLSLSSQGYLQQGAQQGPVYLQQDQYLKEIQTSVVDGRPGIIQCYSCSDCPEMKFNTTIRYCPTDITNRTPFCVKFIEQYGRGGKKIVIRGCASELGSCADIRKQHEKIPYVNLLSCDECDKEACNGSFKFITNHIMMFTTIVIMPVLFKNIL